MTDFNQILREGKIVDNKRVKSLNMKEVLKTIAKDSESFKCAVGYFYLEGLVEIINSLKELREIKILMGYETTKPTKEQLIKAFKDKFNKLDWFLLIKDFNLIYLLVFNQYFMYNIDKYDFKKYKLLHFLYPFYYQK